MKRNSPTGKLAAATFNALTAEIASLKAELAAAKQAHLADLKAWLKIKTNLEKPKRRKQNEKQKRDERAKA